MPYCNAALKAERPEETEGIIFKIAIDEFRAQNAYPLTSGMWNIDAGENDVRAIRDTNSSIIRFFCRNEEDLARTEAKINNFASRNSRACELINNN
jgi:hypothetical protein